jgi:hypothetical protein
VSNILLDAGPIISLTTNNLLWILERLRKQAKSSFSIVSSVKREIVDRPLMTKKFKFEALQVERLIEQGILQVIDLPALKSTALRLLDLANNTFWAHHAPIRIVQLGEMETLAAAVEQRSNRVVVDERITRSLLESPEQLQRLMEQRLHTQLHVDTGRLEEFRTYVRHVELIRSAELVTIAYERGLLNDFVVKVPNAHRELLESVLWGVKLNGCSISEQEINTLVQMELRQ